MLTTLDTNYIIWLYIYIFIWQTEYNVSIFIFIVIVYLYKKKLGLNKLIIKSDKVTSGKLIWNINCSPFY